MLLHRTSVDPQENRGEGKEERGPQTSIGVASGRHGVLWLTPSKFYQLQFDHRRDPNELFLFLTK